MPQQLDIFVLRMADGELAEERRVLAQCRAGQQRHGDRAVHIAFAGDDVAHVSQNTVGGAGHGSDAQLHGGPALGGNDVDVVFLEDLFIKKHECVDLLRERRGILVHLIALEQDLRALLQLCIALFEDAVIFVDNDRHIDRNDVHTEALHQFALVENNGAEGLRPQTDLRDAHTAEILDHTGHADEFVQAFGKDRVAYAAIFNIAERNAVALHLAADAEQAALAVGVAAAVRLKYIVQRPPEQNGKPQLLGDHGGNLFIAEVAVDDENRVGALFAHQIDNRLHVFFVVQYFYIVNALEVDERDVFAGEMLLDIRYGFSCALLRVFPVENAGARGAVSADRHQTDLDMIIQHNGFLPVFLFVKRSEVHIYNAGHARPARFRQFRPWRGIFPKSAASECRRVRRGGCI